MADYFPHKVVLTPDQIKQHIDAATKLALELKMKADSLTTKPYDAALALHIAMCLFCKQWGWHPDDFYQWTKTMFPERVVPTLIG